MAGEGGDLSLTWMQEAAVDRRLAGSRKHAVMAASVISACAATSLMSSMLLAICVLSSTKREEVAIEELFVARVEAFVNQNDR